MIDWWLIDDWWIIDDWMTDYRLMIILIIDNLFFDHLLMIDWWLIDDWLMIDD